MKVLVINGDCLQVNSSANLCHLAYIKGLVDLGYDTTVLSADARDYSIDPSMVLPEEVKSITYYGVSLYEKLSLRQKKQHNNGAQNAAKKTTIHTSKSYKRKIIEKTKKIILSTYGVHGIYSTFVRKASRFKSDIIYDVVISISTPTSSHLLAHKLIKSGHVKAKKWIQIWEDPWYSDAYGFNSNINIYKEEKKLVSLPDRVCYVSPLTLKNQKSLYPASASRMFWQPLPYYYKGVDKPQSEFAMNTYGYFGNYYSSARDLEPFYSAAVKKGITVNICGDPYDLFSSTENIHIYPRISLDKLEPIENNTNVLIFLCNRQGGQIPGKIYQYSATDKTILFILDGTVEEKKVLKKYFGQFHRYIFCENNEKDIMDAIDCIENKRFGDVTNVALNAFEPQETIKRILEG